MRSRALSHDRRSKRRARWSRVKTLFGIFLAGLAIVFIFLTYLFDFKRLRGDLGRWLTEMDQSQRRGQAR